MKNLENLGLVNQLIEIKSGLLDELRALGYSNNTIELYSKEIDYFIDFCTQYDGEITYREIVRPIIIESLQYREKMSPKGKISSNTKEIYIDALKRLFRYIQEEIDGYRDYLAMFDKIKVRKEKKEKPYLNDEEIERFLDVIERNKRYNTFTKIRNTLLAKLLLYGGLRISEALKLTFDDFTDANGGETYKIRVLGKGNKQASVYIRKDLISDELESLREFNRSNRLFVTSKGRNMTRMEATAAINRFYERAGIKKKGLHILRHTLAMKLLREGVDIVHIQKILRHSNISTTTIYAHSTEEDMIKIAKTFKPKNGTKEQESGENIENRELEKRFS